MKQAVWEKVHTSGIFEGTRQRVSLIQKREHDSEAMGAFGMSVVAMFSYCDVTPGSYLGGFQTGSTKVLVEAGDDQDSYEGQMIRTVESLKHNGYERLSS